MDALVYVNHGRPVVDCPFGCGNAYLYEAGQTVRECTGPGGCKYNFTVLAPSNLSELMQELNKRPAKANRNWFPEGHPIAVRGSYPMGQSVADLSAEFQLESGQNGMD